MNQNIINVNTTQLVYSFKLVYESILKTLKVRLWQKCIANYVEIQIKLLVEMGSYSLRWNPWKFSAQTEFIIW